MTRSRISGLCAAAALAAGLAVAPGAQAAPAAPLGSVAEAASSKGLVEEVRHRRGHWRHGHWRRHRGGGWGWGAAAAAGLLLSAPLWAGGYDDGYYGDGYYGDGYYDNGDAYAYGGDGYARCRATFRSFDPASGTYVGYDGVRRMCPYL